MQESSMFEYFGYVAAVLTTASFLPQAIMTIKTKDTASISLTMYLMFLSGVVLWSLYGFHKQDNAMFFANVVTGILAFVILFIKIKNRPNEREATDIIENTDIINPELK